MSRPTAADVNLELLRLLGIDHHGVEGAVVVLEQGRMPQVSVTRTVGQLGKGAVPVTRRYALIPEDDGQPDEALVLHEVHAARPWAERRASAEACAHGEAGPAIACGGAIPAGRAYLVGEQASEQLAPAAAAPAQQAGQTLCIVIEASRPVGGSGYSRGALMQAITAAAMPRRA